MALFSSLFKKDPLQIHGYTSYGTSEHLYLIGRALEHEGVDLEKKGVLNALRNSFKQFMSDELANAEIKIKLPDNRQFYTTTNTEGYFKLDKQEKGLNEMTNKEGWLQLEVGYKNEEQFILDENRFPAEMLIPSVDAEYGVISDIDDTILHTGVASLLKWRLIVNSLFKNVTKRSPLEGASAFYQKLHRGVSGTASNPIFYVSNSPWNLYHYLETFVAANSFPKGPILLRDFKGPLDKRKALPEKPHKQKEIRNILKTYPDLSFVLIGDSGEHDADIYLEVAEEYPDRIKAVYLRSVNSKKRVLRVQGVVEKYKTTPAVLVKKSAEAEAHARNIGLI